MTKLVVCGVAAVLGLAGCEDKHGSITDDIDRTWDFSSVKVEGDARLHSPYVLGAQVTLSAHASDVDDDDADDEFFGWSIVSSDPAVFLVDDGPRATKGGLARGQAVGEGTATLTLRDRGGHEVERVEVEVGTPDRVELDAPGPIILGREADAVLRQARVVEGGVATFLVRYFRGERELAGQGVLVPVAPPGVFAAKGGVFVSERREWLSLLATERTTGQMELRVGEVTAVVGVLVVPASEVAAVEVEVESEQGRDDGDFLVASAEAFDAGGAQVFGVDYGWDAGALGSGDGEFFRYRLRRERAETLVARGGASSASTTIHADQGSVVAAHGCSVGGNGSLLVGLAGLGLVVGRRRRARA